MACESTTQAEDLTMCAMIHLHREPPELQTHHNSFLLNSTVGAVSQKKLAFEYSVPVAADVE